MRLRRFFVYFLYFYLFLNGLGDFFVVGQGCDLLFCLGRQLNRQLLAAKLADFTLPYVSSNGAE